MTDPFVAPGDPALAAPPRSDLADPHLLVARASLALAATWGFLFAQAMAITGAVMPMIDPTFDDVPGQAALGAVAGLVVGGIGLAFTFVWLLGAVMLGQRSSGARVVGLVGHALLIVTCSPFLGAHGLYALLVKTEEPREA